MASSFDTVSHNDETYHEVLALYCAIKDTPGILRVERAEMRQGEVRAIPLDFVVDVELKAKRAIMEDIDPAYALEQWNNVLWNPAYYPHLPVAIREEIGREFNACGLGVDGAYRMLYWKMKNAKQSTFVKPEEIFNGEDNQSV